MKSVTLAAAFAAATLAAGASSAATVIQTITIGPGDFVTTVEILAPGDTAGFTYNASGPLTVSDIAVSGTGNNGGSDIGNVTFGFTDPPTTSFPVVSVGPDGSSAFAGGTLPGVSLMSGESFSIFWSDGITAPVGVTASFTVAAIPVPAAMPLFLAGLGALGVVRQRRKRT